VTVTVTPDLVELARQAVNATHWRWMPGMRTLSGSRVTVVDDDLVLTTGWGQQILPDDPGLPDLADPATVGCLTHLVRTAWNAPRALVRRSSDGRSFHVFDPDRVRPNGGNWPAWLSDDRCPSEVHALVDALGRAPVPESTPKNPEPDQ
jgi:hypothetical protein